MVHNSYQFDFHSLNFTGIELTEYNVMRSVLDDDDRVYWYTLMICSVYE